MSAQQIFTYKDPSGTIETWYLLPIEMTLPEGKDTLIDLDGHPSMADRELLAAFEVSKEAVGQWLQTDLNDALQTAREKYQHLESFMKDSDGGDELHLQQAAVMQNLAATILEMSPLDAEDLSSSEPMGALEDTVELREKFGEFMASEEGKESLGGIANKLRALAGRIERDGSQASDIGSLIEQLGKELLSDLDPQKARKEQAARIKSTVNQSISESLSQSGFAVFSGLSGEEAEGDEEK